MPQPGLIFRALIASPSDCAQERKIIPEVIAIWNAVHSIDRGAIVEPVLWETHSRPSFGDRPQEIINKQLVESCDLVIGAFWTKLGTPTGKAESGTAEEIEQFRSAGKPVLLYFSSAPAVPESVDRDQYDALLKYRNSLGQSGLYSKYESLGGFRDQLQRHFASQMIELLAKGNHVSSGTSPTHREEQENYQAQQLAEFTSQFEAYLRRLIAEWEAERDSNPYSTDDGKYILDRAADELVHFKSMIIHDGEGISEGFGDALKKLRELQRHRTYMDGGKSFQAFWNTGTSVINDLHIMAAKLNEPQIETQQSD